MLEEGGKNQLDEESAFKSGNWAEDEGRGGVVGSVWPQVHCISACMAEEGPAWAIATSES